MNYGSASPVYEQTEPVDFSSAGSSHVNVKGETVMSPSPRGPLVMHSLGSLSPPPFQQHSPSSADLTLAASAQYQQIRSPLSDVSSGGRSFPVTQSSSEDYSDCEGAPPSKMMKPLAGRIRDGRELLQCPTPGCDGKIQSNEFPLGLNTALIDCSLLSRLSAPFSARLSARRSPFCSAALGMGHISGNYATHRRWDHEGTIMIFLFIWSFWNYYSLSGCPHADRSQVQAQHQELKCPTIGCDGKCFQHLLALHTGTLLLNSRFKS